MTTDGSVCGSIEEEDDEDEEDEEEERATPYRSCKLYAMVVVACAGLVSLPICTVVLVSPDDGFFKDE